MCINCATACYFSSRKIEAAGEQAGVRLQQYEQLFTLSLVDDLHRLRDVSNAVPLTVDDLPLSLRERYIGKNGKWLLAHFRQGKPVGIREPGKIRGQRADASMPMRPASRFRHWKGCGP